MSHVVIAWELGGGLGHVMRAAALAHALASFGIRSTVCLADLAGSGWLTWPKGARILPAPHPTRLPGLPGSATFGELLFSSGYHDRRQLATLLTSWTHLLELLHPDLLIANHAPSAQLAARVRALPHVRIGPGFFAPPVADARFRTWEAVNLKHSRRAEAAVLEHVNALWAGVGLATAPTLAAALKPDLELITGWPETDCYADLRLPHEVTYLGLERDAPGGAVPAWPVKMQRSDRRLFLYLKGSYPAIDSVLAYLHDRHCTVAYIPDLNAATARCVSGGRVVLSAAPIDVTRAIAESEALISHSGHMTPSFVAGGKPVFLLPSQAEQRSNAGCLTRLGAGVLLEPRAAKDSFGPSLERFLDDPAYAVAARALAARWSDRPDASATAARAIESLIKSAGTRRVDQRVRREGNPRA